MAESSLSLTQSQIANEVGILLSYGPDYSAFTAAQTTDVASIINRGLRQFYFPPPLPGETASHRWSFLRPVTTLSLVAPYSTGTIAITLGVVTLTTGTFPSWAAGAELTVNGTTYTVSTRDSNSQVTLTDLTITVASGASYSLVEVNYTAPDDFGGMDGDMTLSTGSGYSSIKVVGEGDIRARRQQYDGTWLAAPQYVAVRPATTPLTGQRFQFIFWPTPDIAYTASYRYTILASTLTSGQYPLGGMMHAETILASCLEIAAERLADQEIRKRKFSSFQDRLRASVMLDRETMTADHAGYNGSGEVWGSDDSVLGISHTNIGRVTVAGLS